MSVWVKRKRWVVGVARAIETLMLPRTAIGLSRFVITVDSLVLAPCRSPRTMLAGRFLARPQIEKAWFEKVGTLCKRERVYPFRYTRPLYSSLPREREMRVKLCAKAETYGHEHPGVALKHRTFGVITPDAETEVGLYFRFAQVHIDACIVVIILPVLLAAQVVSQSDAHIEIAEVVFQKRIAHVRAIHHVGVIVFEPVDLEQGNRTLTSDIDEKPIGDVVAHAAYKFIRPKFVVERIPLEMDFRPDIFLLRESKSGNR